MQNAIKRAVEGGYKYPDQRKASPVDVCVILLDPLFWQALGQAQEWFENSWSDEWHNLIDHLAEGKDIDSFFNELLCKKQ